MPAAFVPNPDFEQEFLAESQDQIVKEFGEPIAKRAAELTPRSDDDEHVADHFVVIPSPNGLVYVGNDVRDPTRGYFIYHLFEFGTVDTPAHGSLRSAVSSLGLRLTESRI